MENWFDKNKIFEKLLIFTWIIFLFFCLFLLSFTSHAESYFPMTQNENSNFTDADLNKINSSFDFDNKFIFISYDGSITQWGPYYIKYFWVAQVTKGNFNGDPIPLDQPTIFGEIYSNGYQFSLYEDSDYGVSVVRYYYDNYANIIGTSTSGSLSNLSDLYSSVYDPSKSYISNFSLYTNSSSSRLVVLSYGDDSDFLPEFNFTGHATPPDPYEDPILAQGSNYTLPREVPEAPTIINYNWTTYAPPSVDTSTIENLLESLTDIVKYNSGYLSTNISNEFNTLISGIKDVGDYIVKTIQYYVGLVNDNIINGFTNLYDNIVSLFEPALSALAYIAEPVDGSIIYDNISNTSLVTNISTINSALTSFQTSFNNLSEPNSFTIPIHLENLPVAYFGVQTTQYIDLGVLGSTEKGIIRTFMWALITYSLFITIVDSISNYINGGGDES